jgi:uncharacterized protein with FMN-binding domain
MKLKLKIAAILLVVLISAMVLFAMVGLKEALHVTIGQVDLATIADGQYVGTYRNGRFSNTVTVTVLEHRITDIVPEKAADSGRQVVQTLVDSVITQQRADVDAVAGATATSLSLLKAVENALTGAQTP